MVYTIELHFLWPLMANLMPLLANFALNLGSSWPTLGLRRVEIHRKLEMQETTEMHLFEVDGQNFPGLFPGFAPYV